MKIQRHSSAGGLSDHLSIAMAILQPTTT